MTHCNDATLYPTMSNGTVSAKPQTDQELTQPDIVGTKLYQSLKFLAGWQEAEVPSRFTIGSGDLRKLMIRVREQPVNFMIIIHQSLMTAKEGQKLCGIGSTALGVPLGGDHPEWDGARFTTKTLEIIRESAADLNDRTNGIQDKFRLLRVTVLDIRNDLDKLTSKRERSAFLARLSHYLSKDVRACEDVLRKLPSDFDEIDNLLKPIIGWWESVESQARMGGSSLGLKENVMVLAKVRDSFCRLEGSFANYHEKMSQLYDASVRNLNENDRKYLWSVRDCTDLVVSNRGRFVPKSWTST